jgi:hypothetical protein
MNGLELCNIWSWILSVRKSAFCPSSYCPPSNIQKSRLGSTFLGTVLSWMKLWSGAFTWKTSSWTKQSVSKMVQSCEMFSCSYGTITVQRCKYMHFPSFWIYLVFSPSYCLFRITSIRDQEFSSSKSLLCTKISTSVCIFQRVWTSAEFINSYLFNEFTLCCGSRVPKF